MKRFKRILIGVGGSMVLVLGLAMLVLPGPAVIFIPAGLAILALEFAWAKRWLRSARAGLPRSATGTSPNGTPPRKWNVQSVWRSLKFLCRQVRRTLLPKAKVV
jgi:hypothetical protein